jgi:hypothetical protein
MLRTFPLLCLPQVAAMPHIRLHLLIADDGPYGPKSPAIAAEPNHTPEPSERESGALATGG